MPSMQWGEVSEDGSMIEELMKKNFRLILRNADNGFQMFYRKKNKKWVIYDTFGRNILNEEFRLDKALKFLVTGEK